MLNHVSEEVDALHGQQMHFKLQYTFTNMFNTIEILLQLNSIQGLHKLNSSHRGWALKFCNLTSKLYYCNSYSFMQHDSSLIFGSLKAIYLTAETEPVLTLKLCIH
jgi:hypothetical protein